MNTGTVYIEVIDAQGELVHNHWCVTEDVASTADAVIRATGCPDEPGERERFETEFVALCAEVRRHGLPCEDDNGAPMTREAICWKTPDGRYGVHAAENAWWGWRAAVGIPMAIKEHEVPGNG